MNDPRQKVDDEVFDVHPQETETPKQRFARKMRAKEEDGSFVGGKRSAQDYE